MSNSRRQFLNRASAALMVSAAACRRASQTPGTPPAGAPPAFGTAPSVGPVVSPATFAEGEKLVQFPLSPAARQMAAGNWSRQMAPVYERRTGPRKFSLDNAVAPGSRWDPVLPGQSAQVPAHDRFLGSKADAGPLPTNDRDIAFAPVTQLARWLETRRLTSERLTGIYLDRIARFDPKLRCVITLTRDLALAQAKRADAEIAAGKYRGPLHGIPWGAKDLVDTAGIATTYGAEPFRNRVPTEDAAVVKHLNDAGAVLVARQAWPHDPRRRGRHAGAACHLRTRRRRCVQRAQPSRLRCGSGNAGVARRLLPKLDEGEPRDRRGPRRSRSREEAGHGPCGGDPSRLAL